MEAALTPQIGSCKLHGARWHLAAAIERTINQRSEDDLLAFQPDTRGYLVRSERLAEPGNADSNVETIPLGYLYFSFAQEHDQTSVRVIEWGVTGDEAERQMFEEMLICKLMARCYKDRLRNVWHSHTADNISGVAKKIVCRDSDEKPAEMVRALAVQFLGLFHAADSVGFRMTLPLRIPARRGRVSKMSF